MQTVKRLCRAGYHSVNDLNSYAEGPRFETISEHNLSKLKFSVALLSPWKQIPGYYLNSGQDLFLPNPLKFIPLMIYFH
jgi:hypothetical protein